MKLSKKRLSKPIGQKGQGLTEYMILVALVAVAGLGAAKTFGTTVKNKISDAKVKLNEEINIRN